VKAKLESFLKIIEAIGGSTKPLVFTSVASETEVLDIEQKLGFRLPAEFRDTLLTVSSHCEFSWFLPNDFELPQLLRQIFSGELHWSLELLWQFNEAREGWIREVFSNPEDEYDKVWYNKFVFQEVGNGDFIAIDLLPESYGKVVYLSHDDGEGHGCVMADSFKALLTDWVELGCVGGEDWQWLPFCENKLAAIDPNSENALLWKQVIKL
jgi:cell wall assembly regulator SMI1